MTWRWVEHTAEVELAIEGPDEAAVVGDAVAALGELLGGPPDGPADVRGVEGRAPDRAAQLAMLLEELVFLAEREGFVPIGAAGVEVGEDSIAASVEGALGDPPPLVKAVTYHRLTFGPAPGGGWRATVIFDV